MLLMSAVLACAAATRRVQTLGASQQGFLSRLRGKTMPSLRAAVSDLGKKTGGKFCSELGGQTTVTAFKFDLIRQAREDDVLPLLCLQFFFSGLKIK